MELGNKRVVGVTGAAGLLARHLLTWLKARGDVTTRVADRRTFADAAALDRFVAGCDAIVHLAGANRGDAETIHATNVGLAAQLAAACRRAGARPHIVFANSIQAGGPTAYGQSKAEAARILADWAAEAGAAVTDLVLPHVFGEGGRPFYNSVVSTFCHQLAAETRPTLVSDGSVELLHALDVAGLVAGLIGSDAPAPVRLRPTGTTMGVSDLLQRLATMAADYGAGVIPDLRDPLTLRLFNTYRSYLFPQAFPRPLAVHGDHRGWLFEAVRERSGGQAFVSATRSGEVRGNHYHLFKFERFLVIRGVADIAIRRVGDDTATVFRVTGDRPVIVDMPTMHAHKITNCGSEELLTLFWTNEFFDPANPDTYSEPA